MENECFRDQRVCPMVKGLVFNRLLKSIFNDQLMLNRMVENGYFCPELCHSFPGVVCFAVAWVEIVRYAYCAGVVGASQNCCHV